MGIAYPRRFYKGCFAPLNFVHGKEGGVSRAETANPDGGFERYKMG